jgi:DNA polymerase I-like protein with 3'-5' exonuclease and polymerase domains
MIYINNKEGILQCLNYIRDKEIIALDTETTGLDPLTDKVLLIAIGDEHEQYVVDVAQTEQDLDELLAFIETDKCVKVLHNAKFDYKMLKSNHYIDMQNLKDTYLMDCLVTQGQLTAHHSLDAVLLRYLNLEMSKEQQTSFVNMTYGSSFTDKQIEYAAKDVEHLVPLYTKLLKKIREKDMGTLADLENECLRATGDLELNGIYLDRAKWLSLKDRALDSAKNAKLILDQQYEPYCRMDIFGKPDINYKSPKQILPILQQICDKGITSTGTDALKKYGHHPAVKSLLDYRKEMKKVNTYGEEFYDKNVHTTTGRIHAEFWQLGRAHTGRYASSKPNMQNIPSEAEYRAAFTAQSPDYKIIAADFSGQELRLLAHLSQEPKFLDALKRGVDLHTNSASLVFGIPYDKVSKKERTAAKAITFGLIYGMGPMKLGHTLDINMQEARYLINKYFYTFPYIKQAMDKLESHARLTHVALSPLDQRQSDLSSMDWEDGRQASHALNIAKNLPFQGTGASTTKLALCRIKRRLDKYEYDARLINVVHDEILVEAHLDCVEDVAKLVETEMVTAFNYYAPSVPMEADAHIGDCWIH